MITNMVMKWISVRENKTNFYFVWIYELNEDITEMDMLKQLICIFIEVADIKLYVLTYNIFTMFLYDYTLGNQ